MGAKPSQALKKLQDAERDLVLRFGPENPRAALEASVLRLPRAFADFAAARRELHAFALARASGALDAAEARRILEGASTGARLDDARERFSRVYVPSGRVYPWIVRPTAVASRLVRWRKCVTLGGNRTPSPRLGKNRKGQVHPGFPTPSREHARTHPPKRGPGPSCPDRVARGQRQRPAAVF